MLFTCSAQTEKFQSLFLFLKSDVVLFLSRPVTNANSNTESLKQGGLRLCNSSRIFPTFPTPTLEPSHFFTIYFFFAPVVPKEVVFEFSNMKKSDRFEKVMLGVSWLGSPNHTLGIQIGQSQVIVRSYFFSKSKQRCKKQFEKNRCKAGRSPFTLAPN